MTIVLRIKCSGLPNQEGVIKYLESNDFRVRFNEKEYRLNQEKETTIKRARSDHWQESTDSPKGDIVWYTVRVQEIFNIRSFDDYIPYPFD